MLLLLFRMRCSDVVTMTVIAVTSVPTTVQNVTTAARCGSNIDVRIISFALVSCVILLCEATNLLTTPRIYVAPYGIVDNKKATLHT